MYNKRWRHLGWLVLVGMMAVACMPGRDMSAEDPRGVQIGLPANLFRDIPKGTIDALTPVFAKLMESQTGLKGSMVMLSGPDEVTTKLSENKIQFAVFHGFEFAWAQTKNPALKPLVIVVKQGTKLTAHVIVADDSKITKLDDLKGQSVAIPRGTPEHCRLFLARRIRFIGHRQKEFVSNVTTPAHVTAALDDVYNGKVKATVVDEVALENYKWMNPGRAGKLRSLLKSESFPTGVIAYKEGAIPAADLKRFKDGLTSAHQNSQGLQLMMLWKMSKFDNIPADYQQTLSDIAKAYPPPIGDEP